MTPLISRRADALTGDVAVPGDKSISHRALIVAALSVGETRIRGLLEAADVARTAAALGALGARFERADDGLWHVWGRGVGGLAEPAAVLDMGNSGTAARLLMGVLTTHPFTSFLGGDASLSERPMDRVMAPLVGFGAAFQARSGGRLPVAVSGARDPVPVTFELPQPSAQVKSAVLLAGLGAPGRTSVVEPAPTRDHTEIMLRRFGAEVAVEATADGGRAVTLTGQPELHGTDVTVPGDMSSAAFPLVAALAVPGSALTLRRVGVNPWRRGLLDSLADMGADVRLADEADAAGEAVADIVVKASSLRGIDVPPERAPSMIDEYPILAVAAACAAGTTRLFGLAELRLKESDRLAGIAGGLAACGVKVGTEGDALTIEGCGGAPPGGATVAANLDHRMAMAFLVLGAAARQPVRIDDGAPIDTSFPGFVALMNGLGARIEAAHTP